jgi:hypothetical protein
MAWFARDHTARSLTEQEQVFLAALANLLSDVQPAQIDDSETALTAERDHCLIALIPHRALGGIALVVSLTAKHGDIILAQVGSLGIDHDSIDLGVGVARTDLDPSRPDFAVLLARIREQLFTPMTVRLYGPNQATVWVRDKRDVLRKVGALGTPLGWLDRIVRRAPASEVQIRFVDSEPPPLTEPSGVNEWFATRRGA